MPAYSGYGITSRKILQAGTSANSSTYTSSAILVADYGAYQALSWETVTGSASTLTVQGTLADGANEAIREADWSVLSTVAAQGQFTLDTGSRYLRTIRDTTDSQATVIFHGQY